MSATHPQKLLSLQKALFGMPMLSPALLQGFVLLAPSLSPSEKAEERLHKILQDKTIVDDIGTNPEILRHIVAATLHYFPVPLETVLEELSSCRQQNEGACKHPLAFALICLDLISGADMDLLACPGNETTRRLSEFFTGLCLGEGRFSRPESHIPVLRTAAKAFAADLSSTRSLRLRVMDTIFQVVHEKSEKGSLYSPFGRALVQAYVAMHQPQASTGTFRPQGVGVVVAQ